MYNGKIKYFKLKDSLDTKAIILLQQFASECDSEIHMCCDDNVEDMKNLTGTLTFCLTSPSEKLLRISTSDSNSCDHIKIKSFLEENGLGKILNQEAAPNDTLVV